MSHVHGTLMPFLYPCLFESPVVRTTLSKNIHNKVSQISRARFRSSSITITAVTSRPQSSLAAINAARRAAAYEPVLDTTQQTPREEQAARLNPTPEDYSRSIFLDKCTLTVHAGSGGNGCVAFFRDIHIPDGPPNGGDGGSGGNIWIQAVANQTSLHKLARRGVVKAGRGIGGQGKSQGGRKGEDVCIQVPVGTIVREIWRSDPVAEEEQRLRELRGMSPEARLQDELDAGLDSEDMMKRPGRTRDKWILYPGTTPSQARDVQSSLPLPPKPRRSHLAVLQPPSPINMDLDKAMDQPVLLAAGAAGGLGNPHFASKSDPKPKFATKGELGVRLQLELELKLLADVGLVGLPNAGKSTLLRAISNSRTRVGDWAFTTLEPTIGTVILDDHTGPRPAFLADMQQQSQTDQPTRNNFTVADIPGLIEDAHLDKGLGLGFLRHIERARILAFVIDLSAGDAVAALKNLWREVGEYEELRNREINESSEFRFDSGDPSKTVQWSIFGSAGSSSDKSAEGEGHNISVFPPPPIPRRHQQQTSSTKGQSPPAYSQPPSRLDPIRFQPISSKPWFVIATKADKDVVKNSASADDNDSDSTAVEAASETSPISNPGTNKAEMTTEQNFRKLQNYLNLLGSSSKSPDEKSGAEVLPHPSGHPNGWREKVAAIPVCAMKGEGMDRVIRWMVGLLDRQR